MSDHKTELVRDFYRQFYLDRDSKTFQEFHKLANIAKMIEVKESSALDKQIEQFRFGWMRDAIMNEDKLLIQAIIAMDAVTNQELINILPEFAI